MPALHLAALEGHSEACRILIINKDLAVNGGRTPLVWAARIDISEVNRVTDVRDVIKHLLSSGANPNWADNIKGATALH